MLEDDETETLSPESESHSPPSSRITVAIAATSPPPPPNLTLALPIQHPFRPITTTATTTAGLRDDCWTEDATSVLIDAWGERYIEVCRGNMRQNHWKEVADIVNSRDNYSNPPKTDIQCKNRIDTVKKKFKSEKLKVVNGCGPSRWPFFHRLDRLIAPPLVAGEKSVPVGIPVGVRPLSQFSPFQNHQFRQVRVSPFPVVNSADRNGDRQVKRGVSPVVAVDLESDDESGDSLPPPVVVERAKRPRVEVEMKRCNKGRKGNGNGNGGWGRSVRELTAAMVKFGEAYEAAERVKLEQVVEMEKQRMKFAKDMELQRMKFLIKTQLEISQLSENRGGGSSGGGRVGGSGRGNNLNHDVSDASD